jgi:hypothetical protein
MRRLDSHLVGFIIRSLRTLPLELSYLRRSHADCGTPLRSRTSSPVSTFLRPVRSMKSHLQPEISHVLQHACGRVPCPHQRVVSSTIQVLPNIRAPLFFGPSCTASAPHKPRSQQRQASKTAHTPYKSHRPKGGFLQVAVSAGPVKNIGSLNSRGAGAPDTALRLVGTNWWR